MSTRSAILHQTPTGFQGIYCHSDGYPSYVGHILATHYTTPESIKALIELGDLSSLHRDGTAYAYHRDQDEPYAEVAPRDGPTPGTVIDQIGHDGHIYIYLDGIWHYNGVTTLLSTVLQDPTIAAEIRRLHKVS